MEKTEKICLPLGIIHVLFDFNTYSYMKKFNIRLIVSHIVGDASFMMFERELKIGQQVYFYVVRKVIHFREIVHGGSNFEFFYMVARQKNKILYKVDAGFRTIEAETDYLTLVDLLLARAKELFATQVIVNYPSNFHLCSFLFIQELNLLSFLRKNKFGSKIAHWTKFSLNDIASVFLVKKS